MSFYWFVKKSIVLDILFLRLCSWSIQKKIIFLLKKYIEIAKYLIRFKKFKLGESNLSLFNKKIYYDSALGLAGYQSILTRHNHLLQIEKIHNVKYVVDIGANVGYFSLLIRELFPSSNIIAVEPAEQTYQALQMNFKNDKKIKLLKTAISNRNGFANLAFDSQSSMISALVENGEKETNNRQIIEKVKTITLDELLISNKIPRVDILKIDAE